MVKNRIGKSSLTTYLTDGGDSFLPHFSSMALNIRMRALMDLITESTYLPDSSGKPLVVYHGTTREFEQFDLSMAGQNTLARTARLGIFATDNPLVANQFAQGDGGHVIPLHVIMHNPLEFGAMNVEDRMRMSKDPFLAMHDAIVRFNKLDSWDDVLPEHVDKWRSQVIQIGFDGIIISYTAMDGAGGGTARDFDNPYHHFYIVFSPTQLVPALSGG